MPLPCPAPVVATLLLAALSACAQLPEAPQVQAPRQPPSAAALAAVTTVKDARGPVGEAREQQLLRSLGSGERGRLTARHLALLAAQGETELYRGNDTRLLIDGPSTLGAMKQAIGGARQRVLLESYIFEDQGVAAQMGELLAERAAAGVQVALLIDAVGSLRAEREFFDGLAARGVQVCRFNPLNPVERPGYWGINHRNHRKLLVVDQAVAYTGGINISQVYSSGSSGLRRSRPQPEQLKKEGWRDTQIELRGPVVPALAQSFAKQWQRQGCPGALRTLPREAVRSLPPGDERVLKLLEHEPATDRGRARIYTALLAAIGAAERSVHLTMAYFAPGRDMIDALKAAARRGAEVVLVLPGTSDSTLVLQAGRAYYQELLDAGVQIHEMEHAVMHAKTAVIDGVWSTVGSSNMDWRSFVMNSELNVVVLGADFGNEMERLFERDRAVSPAIKPAEWAKRSWWQRLQQRSARWLEPLL